jgi:hypothetical protein
VGGGGAADRPGASPSEPAKDETKPSPPARDPDNPFGGEDVAPRDQPQSDLTLRKLSDALRDDERAKELEKDTGIPREQLEQFARRFQKPKAGPVGPGREIEVKPGEQAPAKAAANLPGINPAQKTSTKTLRERGFMAQDKERGINEGNRRQPPPGWEGKWEGYKSKLARTTVTSPAGSAVKPRPAAGP